MDLLPLDRLGVHETSAGVVTFGVFLPGIGPSARVGVRVIHSADQFLQDIPAHDVELRHQPDPLYGDYWTATLDIRKTPPRHGRSKWGNDGRYVYRYAVETDRARIDALADPFGREFGVGSRSAFTLGYKPDPWGPGEAKWRTPFLHDLVIYELMLAEFANDLRGAIDRLPYLADLGINCIEVMPVSNAGPRVDWGFMPAGYFGVDERYGARSEMVHFVEQAHALGIAVIIDSVYGHTSDRFPYHALYDALGMEHRFMRGGPIDTPWGRRTDWTRKFTRDFFFTVNHFWLDRFHVDGFRYDSIPEYWDGSIGTGFASLVYETYELAKRQLGGYWARFHDGVSLNLIQCAEHLSDSETVLHTTYCNGVWQNGTRDAALWTARDRGGLATFAHRLGGTGYRRVVTHPDGTTIPKAPLQYIENHDHPRFICSFGLHTAGNEVFYRGDRARWYKIQPYLIAVLLSKGIPLLWQGQELCETYWLPSSGEERPHHLRPMHWEYFYDEVGPRLLRVVRLCLRVRRERAEIRGDEHHFHEDWWNHQRHGVIVFARGSGATTTIVALNFADDHVGVPFMFPSAGRWRNGLDREEITTAPGEQRSLVIPSNYGQVWMRL
ncbi:MAG: alpha-amylase family glycosyl hydrolase [Thermoanaerobaculia bacterium]